MATKRQKYGNPDSRKAFLYSALRRLEAAGVPDSQASAEWLFCEALDCSRVELWSEPAAPVDAATRTRLEEMLARRIAREPVQYILGYTEFLSLRLEVDPRVLIPRPETELVAVKTVDLTNQIPRARLLDIGTGSGCIAIAVSHLSPETTVTACDVSPEALEVARTNAMAHGASVEFLVADILDARFADRFSGFFDVVVSNPPYVPSSEKSSIMPEISQYEPNLAVFASPEPLLFYRAIARQAPRLLDESGWLVLEIHPNQAKPIVALLEETPFDEISIHEDLAGRERIIIARAGWKR